MQFDDTLTEADFRRPLLEPSEERLLAMLRNEPDLAVDGLEHSVVSRLLNLFGGRVPKRGRRNVPRRARGNE